MSPPISALLLSPARTVLWEKLTTQTSVLHTLPGLFYHPPNCTNPYPGTAILGPPPVSLSSLYSNYTPLGTYGNHRQHPHLGSTEADLSPYLLPTLNFLQKDNIWAQPLYPSPPLPCVPCLTFTLQVISTAADSRDSAFLRAGWGKCPYCFCVLNDIPRLQAFLRVPFVT